MRAKFGEYDGWKANRSSFSKFRHNDYAFIQPCICPSDNDCSYLLKSIDVYRVNPKYLLLADWASLSNSPLIRSDKPTVATIAWRCVSTISFFFIAMKLRKTRWDCDWTTPKLGIPSHTHVINNIESTESCDMYKTSAITRTSNLRRAKTISTIFTSLIILTPIRSPESAACLCDHKTIHWTIFKNSN